MNRRWIGYVVVAVGVFFLPTQWPQWYYAPASGLIGLVFYASVPPEHRRTRLPVFMGVWFGLPLAAWLSHQFFGFP